MSNKRNAGRGRDVAAPERAIIWNGKRYVLTFNNRTARLVEDIYDQHMGRGDLGYYDAMNELAVPKHRALMAFMYAAIVSGGGDVAWEDFEKDFRLDDIEGMAAAIRTAVADSLPEGSEDDAKNAEAAPEEPTEQPTDTPGRG